MQQLNKAEYRDKVNACWLGKNIGGTMGTPYEGSTNINDIKGFVSKKGEPLPNDDLDLQLAWLLAIEERGPFLMSSAVLGEYWCSYVVPYWNEYGIGKRNLRSGIFPPLSGELNNDAWRNSNGAWIRSEVWACLAPALPNVAIKYAFMDASVDHGFGEGTYAEIFTASVESAAFVEKDIRKLIDIGLSKIPSDCRVAKSIRMVIDSFEKGNDWMTTRNMIVEDSKDLGWFQAPANLAFVIIGLLYGNCDFKNSMIIAINCGDDTDCTGATVGALLGIIGGMEVIPEDWASYIGDRIITVSLNQEAPKFPKTCTELTDRVCAALPCVLYANKAELTLTDSPTQISADYVDSFKGSELTNSMFRRSRYSYDVPEFVYAGAIVEFDCEPIIQPLESIKVRIRFENKIWRRPQHFVISLRLPDGFTATGYRRNFHLSADWEQDNIWEATITAGEIVEPMNRVIAEVQALGHPTAALIPITLLG